VPVYDAAGAELGGVVLDLVETLLGRELECDRLHVVDAVRRAARAVAEGAPLRIRLHPQDVRTLVEQGVDLGDHLARDVTVVPDADVELGGALVDSGCRHVDARLSSALDRLREAVTS
jgi:flagellar assembly protein FliH